MKLGNVTINTKVDGKEGAPWLVLSNSLGATFDMWNPQIPFLTKKYRVLRYDTRGHGGSDTPAGPYSFADLTADVIGLMDRFDIKKTSFMGLSMGGGIGIGLALEHPDRIERIICADGRCVMSEPAQAAWDERIARVEKGGLETIVESSLAAWLTPEWHSAHPDQLLDVAKMILSNDPKGYIACCHAIKNIDYYRHLGDIKVPVLYVGGDQDMGAPPEVMQDMADVTPGASFNLVEGGAHVANLNVPEAFNAATKEFLGI
ncbi:MAG: 3-oxoadipate enol-lactonase [Rhizobiales bacterium]|nr:3-oxoadipate enol-lactonase [Hyphomicrobiales bacterium]